MRATQDDPGLGSRISAAGGDPEAVAILVYNKGHPFTLSRRASALVARRVRAVRVAMERAAIERTGAPVRLATGRCRATLVLSPRGRVEEMIGTRCSNAGIRRAFDRAVFNGQPLRMGGGGRSRRVPVVVIAALAEPGSEDGFTH